MGTVKYSGPVASFHCPTEATIRSLKVHFSPKQEGSGDPSPENVRPIVGWEGVEVKHSHSNLLPAGTHTRTQNGITFTYYPNGDVHIEGTATKDAFLNVPASMYFSIKPGKYTLSGNISNSNVSIYIVVSSANGGDIGFRVSSGSSTREITFTDDSARLQMSVGSGRTVNVTVHPRLEMGDFTELDTTEYEFGVLGKNKFDPNCDMWNYSAYSKNGDEITQSSSDGRGWIDATIKPISLKAGTYTLTCSDGNNFNLRTSIDGYETNTSLQNGGGTFTLSQDCDVKIKHSVKSGNSYPTTFTVQLELGSTATAYEPYDPKHTVYGGWVDLISGEVCATHEMADLSDLEWSVYSGNRCNTTDLSFLIKKSSSYSSLAPLIGEQVIAGRMSMNLSDFPDAVACNINGTLIKYYDGELPQGKIVYELAEPIAYQLAPTSMQTFLGQNNVWSNADYVEVEYDLHETQTILARKQFIMANQPHIESASGAIASFNTDLRAPLKECKVYFSPVQEGTGDPSPDNVRPISGWTGVEVMRSPKNIFPKSLPEQLVKGNWATGSTSISAATNARCFSIYIGTNRTLKFTKTGTLTMQLAFTDSPILDRSNTLYGAVNCANRATYTLNSNEHPYLGISIISVSAWDTLEERECILRFNETPEGFEARVDWEPIPIDWTDSAGTIYGGYVDLVTGEIWGEWELKKNSSQVLMINAPNYLGDVSTQFYFEIPARSTNDTRGYVDCAKYLNNSAEMNRDGAHDIWNYDGASLMHMRWLNSLTGIEVTDDRQTRITKIKAYIANNPIHTCIPLATPIMLGVIDPTTITTLRGTNNIWASNSGDNIEIAYWKH